MFVRKGKADKKERTFCQTSFCVSFTSASAVNSPDKAWKRVQIELPEKKVWRSREMSRFGSSRGGERREWDIGTRLESVKWGSGDEVIANFCN